MSTMKRYISLLLVLCLLLSVAPITAHAVTDSGTCGENLTWTLSDDGVLTISGTGKMNDYDYNEFAPWLGDYNEITTIVIEDGVTSIGNYAFYGLYQLNSVSISESVAIIGESAFNDCIALTSIMFPDSVTEIQGWAFSGCENLTDIDFGNGIMTIGEAAFQLCGSLTTLNLGDGVISLEGWSFNACNSLVEVNIGENLSYMDPEAFIQCDKLNRINVSDSNNTFSSIDGVLFNKEQTELLIFPCTRTGSYDVPDGVITIGERAFLNAKGLISVTLPDTLISIGRVAFYDCSSLTSIVIPNGITQIEDSTFHGCSSLSEITIPDGVTSIESGAFDYCTSLTSITIPASVSSVGEAPGSYTFGYCDNLEAINVDPENQSYCSVDGVLMSKDQTELFICPPGKTGSYTVPDTVTFIKCGAFGSCTKLTDVTIGDSVTDPSNWLFMGCSNLKSVTLGKSITEIPFMIFGSCENLEEIIFCGDAPEFDYRAFWDYDGEGIVATAYYPSDNSTWTSDKLMDYGGTITWVPYTDPNSTPNNGTYTSPQESVWYDIWCAGVSRFNAEKNYDLNVGNQTYPTGDSWKARADISLELAEQVSISKNGWVTCEIPRELVYTCREVVLYPDNQNTPFAQFVAARNNGDSMYVNLSCSHLSVYENAMRTYDMYVDINWNGYNPGKIYLKQGDKILDLREGKNQGLLLGMFTASGGDLLLCWETAEGTVYSQKMYLDIYKNSTSNMKLDSGESISGTNPASEAEDEMWGNLSFSMDLFNDSVPVELELSPTGLNKGTFKGTIGVNFENADDKKTVIDLLDTNLNKNWDYWTFDSLKKTLNAKYPETLIPQQATSFVISADTQLIGVVEGTYELGTDGSLVDMQLTDSKILSSVDGKFSVTRQHLVTPVPWYWTLELKAGFELALELQNEYDGTAASIAPLNSEVKVGIGAKAAVGVSGAASVGVKGGGNVYVTGQVLPIDFSKTEIYSTYDISLYGEFGPFKGDVFPYKSDKYYIWKNGKWVFSTNPSTGGGGGFRDSIPDSGLEMQQISRDYLKNATLSNDVHSVQLNSVADASVENLVKANTYTFTEPQIVGLDNGNLLLVWVDDPGVAVRPVDINRAALFYSVYDGSIWSEPAMVSDDGTADASPVLKNIDGNVYLLWNNANAVFGEATDYEEYCASLDIAYARFDTANAEFTDVTVIDTNESCDILPDMTLVNGVSTVVWIQNDANDPFQASGGNKLYAASRKAGNWSVTVLADDLMVVDGLAVTGNGDVLNVYISQDTDGDMSTVEDRELFRVSENTVSQVTDNDTADLKPTLIDDSLYWYQNGVLTDGTQIVQLAEDTDRYVTTGNGTDSAVLYQRFNEDDSVTICANILHDSVWSDVVELVTIDRYLQKFDAVMADDGSITIITNEVELNDNVYQQADLCSYVFGQKCDIAVQQVYLNPLSMAPGGEMELYATLKNMGTAGTSNVYARIYDGENLLKEEPLPVELDAGAEATVILTYPLEEGFDSKSLRVEFWPESVTDGNEGNNTANCEIACADVSVEELTAIQSNGKTQVSAYISNRGLTALSDVEVILYTKADEQKTVIDSCAISSLAVAKGETVSFDATLEIDTVVYVEAVTVDEEFNYSNNAEYTIVTEASDVQLTTKPDKLTGECGNDITWSYDLEAKVLTIEGTGRMWNQYEDDTWSDYYISYEAFDVEYLYISEGVTHIGSFAFVYCGDLKYVEIPESVESIGEFAFSRNCPWIDDKISAGSDVVVNNILICSAKTGEIRIDAPIKYVVGGAIENATNVTFGETVATIGSYAVDYFDNPELKSITILNPECEILYDAFGIGETYSWDEAFTYYIVPGLTIYGYPDSTAQMYCEEVNNDWRWDEDFADNPWNFIPIKRECPFTDVPEGTFYYEPVMWAVENSITNGTTATTFGPNDQCMRAHVVTFLWRAVGSPEPTRTDNPFVDVKPTDFYYKPVLWAVENGITSGMDATHFGPTAYCNRAQVVTFLYRTMGSPDVGAATNPFTDVATGSFYEKPVLWAVENGVTAGLSATSFGPNSICNRAQIVTFLYRAFVD